MEHDTTAQADIPLIGYLRWIVCERYNWGLYMQWGNNGQLNTCIQRLSHIIRYPCRAYEDSQTVARMLIKKEDHLHLNGSSVLHSYRTFIIFIFYIAHSQFVTGYSIPVPLINQASNLLIVNTWHKPFDLYNYVVVMGDISYLFAQLLVYYLGKNNRYQGWLA